MTFEGAVVKEQGVTFAIVVVKKHVVDDRTRANEAIGSFARVFGNVPTILMAQGAHGTPKYYGRRDIVNFMSKVPVTAIPWKKYTI